VWPTDCIFREFLSRSLSRSFYPCTNALDLFDTFDACSDGHGETLRVQPNDLGHFDARGHACVATAIAGYIERSHELPAR
jgi:lysophospholipase L1-like esterase